MQNVKLDRKNGLLVITVDLKAEGVPSVSGKTTVIASTKGNVAVPGAEGTFIGLNVYKK